MDSAEFKEILKKGETLTVEFKTWINAKNFKERVNLAVPELVAFANAKGGTVYMGVEDNKAVTGCTGSYDLQQIVESVYDKTRPSLFVEASDFEYEGKKVIALSVDADGTLYATSDGRCLKRLGRNTKPYYPSEIAGKYKGVKVNDFSRRIIEESSESDIDKLEIYRLKEKLRTRDSGSTLPDMDDLAFLKDLGLVVEEKEGLKLTVAGLLFVGKEASIRKILPGAEVIYLHYGADNLNEYDSRLDLKQPIITVLDRLTEQIQNYNKIVNVQVGLYRLEISDFSTRVFQEALLNAMAHRDYEKPGAVYVKHYPDKIVISNPGGFMDDINSDNIITHPSSARNQLIAETLQRLKYVQRTGQGVDIIYHDIISAGKHYPDYRDFGDAVELTIYSDIEDKEFVRFIAEEQDHNQRLFSLAELMILRYVSDTKRIRLSDASKLIQMNSSFTRSCLQRLVKNGLLETVGREYMLSARVYGEIKSDVEYTRDKTIQYLRAKALILEYLENEDCITREKVQELCSYSEKQARTTLEKLGKEGILVKYGSARRTKYKRAE